MKQTVLAYRVGVDRSYISNYLSGKYKPNAETHNKIANVLNVSPDWLNGFDVPMIDETVTTTIDEKTQLLVELFNEVPEDEQDKVINLIKVALGKYDL
jgi:transcriptional regulator with XRE-family HTH domain